MRLSKKHAVAGTAVYAVIQTGYCYTLSDYTPGTFLKVLDVISTCVLFGVWLWALWLFFLAVVMLIVRAVLRANRRPLSPHFYSATIALYAVLLVGAQEIFEFFEMGTEVLRFMFIALLSCAGGYAWSAVWSAQKSRA